MAAPRDILKRDILKIALAGSILAIVPFSQAMAGWDNNILAKQEKLDQAQARIQQLERQNAALAEQMRRQYQPRLDTLVKENSRLSSALTSEKKKNSLESCRYTSAFKDLENKNKNLAKQKTQAEKEIEAEYKDKLDRYAQENTFMLERLMRGGIDEKSGPLLSLEDIRRGHQVVALQLENQELKARLELLSTQKSSVVWKPQAERIVQENNNDNGEEQLTLAYNDSAIQERIEKSYQNNKPKEDVTRKPIEILSARATVGSQNKEAVAKMRSGSEAIKNNALQKDYNPKSQSTGVFR
ncbi:MAG: hypothetical protein KDI13_05010 [Alphaproteobacteria bacterium]|nr:hypothetical protein [Alphaproteobacteria bacterium]